VSDVVSQAMDFANVPIHQSLAGLNELLAKDLLCVVSDSIATHHGVTGRIDDPESLEMLDAIWRPHMVLQQLGKHPQRLKN
jgi:hypothetical protein